MSIKLGNTDINALGNNVNKAYLGAIEVFTKTSATAFVSVWETTTANETITLPTPTNYEVDWGDGTVTINTNSHEYGSIGEYTITIEGNINDFAFNAGGDRLKIIDVVQYGSLVITTGCFQLCSRVSSFPSDIPTLSTSLNSSYRQVSNTVIFDPSISLWNTSLVESMMLCFFAAASFDEDLSLWDYSSVKIIDSFCRSTNLSTNNYDKLLIRLDDEGNGGLTFSNLTNMNMRMDTLQYTSFGATAHASLITKGLIITDAGQV